MTAARPRPFVSRRGALVAVIAAPLVSWTAVIALTLWARSESWPHREPEGHPEFGINFSCNYAEYLLLERPGGPNVPDDRPGRDTWCAETFGRLLDLSGAKHVRLSVEWNQVEPKEGLFDFGLLDAQLRAADQRGARVLLSVGIKGQRHPEYYIPDWLLAKADLPWGAIVDEDPDVAAAALLMMEAVVRHTAQSRAIDSWSADNEPFVRSRRAEWWRISSDFVAREIEAIRTADPSGRRVVVNNAGVFTWYGGWDEALALGDVLGASVYPFRNVSLLGLHFVANILELGPFSVNHVHLADEARRQGKEFWITEMQAEPWFEDDPRLYGPERPSKNLTLKTLERSLSYGRRSGAARVYLWGAEWWLFQQDVKGDQRWMAAGRTALTE